VVVKGGVGELGAFLEGGGGEGTGGGAGECEEV